MPPDFYLAILLRGVAREALEVEASVRANLEKQLHGTAADFNAILPSFHAKSYCAFIPIRELIGPMADTFRAE